MNIKLTIFNSVYTTSKIPISPYGDNTFDFSLVVTDLKDVHNIFKDNFVLSSPIKSTNKIRKTIANLEPLQLPNNYIILDFDKVYEQVDVDNIIEYFKNNNYMINIFKSKSFGITTQKGTSYNIKGVMPFYYNGTLSSKQTKEGIINYLNSILGLYCDIDTSSSSIASHQAPTDNGPIIYIDGNTFDIDVSEYVITKPAQISVPFDTDISHWFYNHLVSTYGAIFKSSSNSSGSVVFNVSLPIEVKSRFGYFWSPNIPYILQHPQKTKNINMFSDFLKSDEGKIYIKKQHLITLQNAFINSYDYNQNSRYFIVDDELKQKIDTFKDILIVKGIMGSGKSNVIEYFLSKKQSRVLLLTMRRSLAIDMSSKYNIKNYIDDLNNNTKSQYKAGDSLVIQVDSLYRINPDDFDCVIIDEFESLCLYVANNLKQSNHYVKDMKYLKMLFEKKLILADAFINKFTTEMHFNNRDIVSVNNNYKDTCKVYTYEYKQTFITFLEKMAISKSTDEFITCSFGTLSELYSVERLLQDHGLRVVSITSDTSDNAKDIIYKLFEEKHHNKYDIILFSPTITVGVSILNNVKHHFHFDSGKSIDPISSIQMLKRSRTVENIHIFIKGKQTYIKSYDVEYLNELAKNNIKEYLNDNKNIIFYNVDDDTLSKLGMFVNTFTAHSNFFSNDHENTFKFLLTQQFERIRNITEDIPHHKFDRYQKEINSDIKYLTLFDGIDNINTDYTVSDMTYLQNKSRNDDEDRELLFLTVKAKFPRLNDDIVLDIAKEYNKDRQYLDKLNAFIIFVTKKQELTTIITDYALNNISSLFSKDSQDDYIKLLKFMNTMDIQLNESYSVNDLKILNTKYITKNKNSNVNFSWFLHKIGYVNKKSNLMITHSYKKHISSILKNKEELK
jgi:hypothetical protein